MNRDFIEKYWYAFVYERDENQTDDVEFMLKVIAQQTGGKALRVIEAACGGGRICVPLARAGHDVTGFDFDSYMLLRAEKLGRGYKNLRLFQADAIEEPWGADYELAVVAGNFLINIEGGGDYKTAQQTLLKRAADALRPGGHLYLDFNIFADPAAAFGTQRTSVYFEGEDDMGTWGRTVSCGGVYDPSTQIVAGAGHTEYKTADGDEYIKPRLWYKHIPTLEQVYGWLRDAGLEVRQSYKNYTEEPIGERLPQDIYRAVLWCEKV